MTIQRVAGYSALLAVLCNVLGASVLIGSAVSAGIDVSLIAGEPTAEVHRAVNAGTVCRRCSFLCQPLPRTRAPSAMLDQQLRACDVIVPNSPFELII